MNSREKERLYGFPPLIGADAKVLILGSFPSVASLSAGEYYAFGRNHFWTLIAAVLGVEEPRSWVEKQSLLIDHGIALWDVYESCVRDGSLDKHIDSARLNDVGALLFANPRIKRVILNGSRSASVCMACVRSLGPRVSFGASRDFFGKKSTLPLGEPVLWPLGSDRVVQLIRVPSSSPVPSRAFRTIEAKIPYWHRALREGEICAVL